MKRRALRPKLAFVSAAIAAAILLTACGGGDSSTTPSETTSSSTSTTTDTQQTTKVPVYFQRPRTREDKVGAFLLKAGKTSLVINSFAQGFDLPPGLKVDLVNGLGGGPFYNPRSDTITFQYGFANLIFNTIREAHPDWSNYRIGQAGGAVDSFILAHEFTHALIANFDLPVLGREEDAADTLAGLILLRADGGNQMLLDTADFWAQFSQRQAVPTLSAYADTHSLDLQRAFSMACDVAGSSRKGFILVARLGLLPRSRLQGCPAEFKQQVDSFEQVLEPHTDGALGLGG